MHHCKLQLHNQRIHAAAEKIQRQQRVLRDAEQVAPRGRKRPDRSSGRCLLRAGCWQQRRRLLLMLGTIIRTTTSSSSSRRRCW